jgi:hypothetical protein
MPGYYQEAGLIIKQARDLGSLSRSSAQTDLTPVLLEEQALPH